MKNSNLNTIHNINHIIKQKTNNINITKEMVGFTWESSDKLIRHNPAATTEWDNSGYSYINGESQVSAVIDQSTYELVRLFFNSRPKNLDSSKSTMFKHRSILKTFIGRPRVKSSLNRARITIYKYNRQKVYYMNMLKKSFMLSPNKNLKKQSVNLNVKAPSKKLVTTIVNPSFYSFLNSKNKINSKKTALPITGIKKDVFSFLGREKKGIRTYSSYAVPFSSRYIKKETNVRYLSQKRITLNNSNIRKVPSVLSMTNKTLPTVKNNNLSIIRSGKGSPNLVIIRSNSKKMIANANNIESTIKSEQNIQILRKNIEILKKRMGKKSEETNFTSASASNNNHIVLTYVKKGYKKNTDSKMVTKLGKLPFNKNLPGTFKIAKKGVRIFTPKSYGINNIRYWYPPVISLAKNRKTNKNIINSRRSVQKGKNIKKERYNTLSNKRISRWIQRQLQKKVQKGKKRIFFNILRNKTFQLVLSTLNNSFKSKPSVLVLNKIENYSIKFFLKVQSLKLFLFNYANMGTYKCTPNFVLTIWNKLINTTNSPLSTLLLTKKGEKIKRFSTLGERKGNNMIIPSLRLGKLVGKFYKRIFASKFYYTILWTYYMKSNNLYLSRLNNILKKRYGKKISLNIVDLKYLYLDSNIMASAITTKLKDRKKRVLRVLKRALGLIKKPYFKIHFYNRKKTLEQLNVNFLLMDKNLNMSTYSLSKNILNKDLFKKPSNYKSRLLLFHLKHKIVSGVRLQGSGRLTRRLTASRSISKFKYMGSLQNIESSRQAVSTVMLRGYMKSNLQYMNINSYNRNGAFGVKVSVSSY